MSIATYIIAGLIVGFLASKLIIRTREGLMRDLGLGMAGAILAGGIFGAVGPEEAHGLNVFGLVVTLAGSAGALVVYHTLFTSIRPG